MPGSVRSRGGQAGEPGRCYHPQEQTPLTSNKPRHPRHRPPGDGDTFRIRDPGGQGRKRRERSVRSTSKVGASPRSTRPEFRVRTFRRDRRVTLRDYRRAVVPSTKKVSTARCGGTERGAAAERRVHGTERRDTDSLHHRWATSERFNESLCRRFFPPPTVRVLL